MTAMAPDNPFMSTPLRGGDHFRHWLRLRVGRNWQNPRKIALATSPTSAPRITGQNQGKQST